MNQQNRKSDRRRQPPRQPPTQLVFSPLAWLKLLFFLHVGDTEVGFFCISHSPEPDDLLYIDDILTLKQCATVASFEFDQLAVIDFFEQMAQQSRKPDEFWAIIGHTHPGSSAQPTTTDEQSIGGYFDRHPWSIMFIISREHQTYARLSFTAGPGAQVLLGVAVDWEAWPKLAVQGQDLSKRLASWKAEYEQNIHQPPRRGLIPMFYQQPEQIWDYEEYDFYGQEWPPPGFFGPVEGQVIG
jgi:hypothetical protein